MKTHNGSARVVTVLAVLFCVGVSHGASFEKRRHIILTDQGNDLDDQSSLVRMLLYGNEIDIEGLIAVSSKWMGNNELMPELITERIDAYGEVLSNLQVHASGWPSVESLKSVTASGQPFSGMEYVGDGMSTEGSELIIDAVEKDDARPVYIGIWGGSNTLAQALWDAEKRKSDTDFESFIAKIQVYFISDQDDAGPWIRGNFPNLVCVSHPGGSISDCLASTWHAFLDHETGADNGIAEGSWFRTHIRNDHGPLGALWLGWEFVPEGDTPSSIRLVPNGLNFPERPDYGGWGGRWVWMKPNGEETYMWSDMNDAAKDEVNGRNDNFASIWRWRKGYQWNFAGRMDWCVAEDYSDANHEPVAAINGDSDPCAPLRIPAAAGETVVLDATGSADSDDDSLSFRWIYYKEAGSFDGDLTIADTASPLCSLSLPGNFGSGDTAHIILELKDSGTPGMYSYKRALITSGGATRAALCCREPFVPTCIRPYTALVAVDDREQVSRVRGTHTGSHRAFDCRGRMIRFGRALPHYHGILLFEKRGRL